MTAQSFSTSFTVEQSPDEVFRAITNVRGWWTGDVEGGTAAIGDEFTYRFRDLHYSKQLVTKLVPGETVAWRVMDARLAFAGVPDEWTGTDIRFEIDQRKGGTDVRFTHVGLGPELDCYDNCSSGWGFFINGSLRRLITKGEGPMTPPWA